MAQLDVAAADTQMFVALTKSAPFWIAGRCQGAAGYSVPLSSQVPQHRDGPSFLQVHKSTRAASGRQPQDLNSKLRSPVQSKAKLLVELQQVQAPLLGLFQ